MFPKDNDKLVVVTSASSKLIKDYVSKDLKNLTKSGKTENQPDQKLSDLKTPDSVPPNFRPSTRMFQSILKPVPDSSTTIRIPSTPHVFSKLRKPIAKRDEKILTISKQETPKHQFGRENSLFETNEKIEIENEKSPSIESFQLETDEKETRSHLIKTPNMFLTKGSNPLLENVSLKARSFSILIRRLTNYVETENKDEKTSSYSAKFNSYNHVTTTQTETRLSSNSDYTEYNRSKIKSLSEQEEVLSKTSKFEDRNENLTSESGDQINDHDENITSMPGTKGTYQSMIRKHPEKFDEGTEIPELYTDFNRIVSNDVLTMIDSNSQYFPNNQYQSPIGEIKFNPPVGTQELNFPTSETEGYGVESLSIKQGTENEDINNIENEKTSETTVETTSDNTIDEHSSIEETENQLNTQKGLSEESVFLVEQTTFSEQIKYSVNKKEVSESTEKDTTNLQSLLGISDKHTNEPENETENQLPGVPGDLNISISDPNSIQSENLKATPTNMVTCFYCSVSKEVKNVVMLS